MYQFDRSSTNALERTRRHPASSSARTPSVVSGDELLVARDEPAVERPQVAGRFAPSRLEPLDVRVVDEELDRVPERQQPPLDLVAPARSRSCTFWLGTCSQYIQRTTSAPIRSIASFASIAFPVDLCISRAGLVADPLVGEHALVRRPALERHRHERHRVEPEPDLLAALRDPVGREPLLPVRVIGEVGAGEALRRARRIPPRHPLGVAPAERRERDDARRRARRRRPPGSAAPRRRRRSQRMTTSSIHGRCSSWSPSRPRRRALLELLARADRRSGAPQSHG